MGVRFKAVGKKGGEKTNRITKREGVVERHYIRTKLQGKCKGSFWHRNEESQEESVNENRG